MTGPDVTASLVLWLGEAPAPEDALARAGMEVWALPGDLTAREVVALAPDLVVLVGESVARGPALVRELADQRPMGVVPVAILGEPAERGDAAGGALERIPASARGDELATAIAAAIARREGIGARAQQELDARGIERLVGALVAERRAAVLLRGSPPGAVALAADGGRAAALGSRGEGSSVVRVYERAPGKLAVLGPRVSASDAAEGDEPSLAGVAAVVIDDGMADWDGVARALEEAGAKVTLADAERGAVEEARASDPALVVVATSVLATPAGVLVCEDPRLASASLLVVREDPRAELDPARVVRAARRLCAGEIALRARALAGEAMVERIEALGVVRWLKTYADAGMAARLRLRSASGCGEIRLEGGKIRAASFEPGDGSAALEGGAAARALLSLRRGTILAGPAEAKLHERVRPAVGASGGDEAEGAAVEAPVAGAEVEERGEPAEASGAAGSAVLGGASGSAGRGSGGAEARGAEAGGAEAGGAEATGPVLVPRRRSVGAVAAAVAAGAVVVAVAGYGWSGWSEGAEGGVTEVGAAPAMESVSAARAEWAEAEGEAESEAESETESEAESESETEAEAEAESETETEFESEPESATETESEAETASEAEAESETESETASASASEPALASESASASRAEAESESVAVGAAAGAPGGISANRLVLQADDALRRRAYAEALAIAEQALALDPRHPRATYDRALALLRLGRADEALEGAMRAAQLDREEPLYPLLVGDIHQQYGRRARALSAWRACSAAHPDFEPCQRRLARAAAR